MSKKEPNIVFDLEAVTDPESNPFLLNKNVLKKRNESADKLLNELNDVSFEWFVLEWCYGVHLDKYPHGIFKVGGAGDRGRDVACFVSDSKGGSYVWDNYQCKFYEELLSPSHVWKDIGKVIYFSYKKIYPSPRKYYFLAKKGVGPKLLDLIKNPSTIKDLLKENWQKHCQLEIASGEDIKLVGEFELYLDQFDFSIFDTIAPMKLFEEHAKTRYHYMRFGVLDKIKRPEPEEPDEEILDGEKGLQYVQNLLEVYSEEAKSEISTVDNLKSHPKLYENFKRHRRSFYFAEQLKTFGKENFPPDADYSSLLDQVYEGVVEMVEEDCENGSKRLSKVLTHATQVQVSEDHILFPSIRSMDKKGICHQLSDLNRIRWIKKK